MLSAAAKRGHVARAGMHSSGKRGLIIGPKAKSEAGWKTKPSTKDGLSSRGGGGSPSPEKFSLWPRKGAWAFASERPATKPVKQRPQPPTTVPPAHLMCPQTPPGSPEDESEHEPSPAHEAMRRYALKRQNQNKDPGGDAVSHGGGGHWGGAWAQDIGTGAINCVYIDVGRHAKEVQVAQDLRQQAATIVIMVCHNDHVANNMVSEMQR